MKKLLTTRSFAASIESSIFTLPVSLSNWTLRRHTIGSAAPGNVRLLAADDSRIVAVSEVVDVGLVVIQP